ncbi:MAG: winged helix-turn-helix transcriptional regulator [Candidatus Helarchaeota archaeon]
MSKQKETIWKKFSEEEFINMFKLKANKIKFKIIKILLDNDAPLYQAQIARKVKRTSSGIRLYLNELVKLNLIKKEKINRYVYYEITDYGKNTIEKLKEYL